MLPNLKLVTISAHLLKMRSFRSSRGLLFSNNQSGIVETDTVRMRTQANRFKFLNLNMRPKDWSQ